MRSVAVRESQPAGIGAPGYGQGLSPSSPFRGPGLLARIAPFAIVALGAEASLALPPGGHSPAAVIVSIVLLLAVAASLLLPWQRMPAWTTVLVPLAYTGSVLALILAAGPTSGVGIVILIPLIWTALFHRRWESGCIVIAIVIVEVITSLTPVVVPDSVLVRRMLLWAALGVLISVATHGLRDRIAQSQRESAQLQARLRELTVLEDRDRIAAELQDTVVTRLFAAGLALQAAVTMTASRSAAIRIESAVTELDEAVRLIRESIFGMQHAPRADGLQKGIVDLCAELLPPDSSPPDLSFSGRLDRSLPGDAGYQVLAVLREALVEIGKQGRATHIGVTVGDDVHLTVVGAAAGAPPGGGGGQARDLSDLNVSARHAGASLEVEQAPDGGSRYSWHFPRPAA